MAGVASEHDLQPWPTTKMTTLQVYDRTISWVFTPVDP
jgi:hypothetical protein